MDTKMDKSSLKLWIAIWICLIGQALIYGYAIWYVMTTPEPEAEQSVRQEYPPLGFHCDDGKAFITTTKSGGFATTSAVVVDGQFVDCEMTYKVNGQEISALGLLQHLMSN